MARLEDLTTGTLVKGIVPDATAELVGVKWHGSEVLEVVYKDSVGRVGTEILFRDREPSLQISTAGQRVFDQMAQAFRNGQGVQLAFANVELTIPAFLNAAIGQLYGEFTEEGIRARLSVTDISESDLALVKLVVDNAKVYFRRQRAGAVALKNELQAVAGKAVSSTPTN